MVRRPGHMLDHRLPRAVVFAFLGHEDEVHRPEILQLALVVDKVDQAAADAADAADGGNAQLTLVHLLLEPVRQ